MEKEITSGAMLGILIVSLMAIIGLGFMVFGMYRNDAGLYTAASEQILATNIANATLTVDDYALLAFKASKNIAILTNISLLLILSLMTVRLQSIRKKFGIEDYSQSSSSRIQKIMADGKVNELNALRNLSGNAGEFDSIQYRTYMKHVNPFKLVKCNIDELLEEIGIVVDRTARVEVSGKVSKRNEYYSVGNNLILPGEVVLKPGTEVKLVLEAPVGYNTSLGVFEEYKVLSMEVKADEEATA